MKSPSKPKSAAKTSEQASSTDEKQIQNILKSGQALLEKIQEMNPNSARYPLKTEMCEAEFRDVLLLDPLNVPAIIGLSELFSEFYDEGASEEALSLVDEVLKNAKGKELKALKACKKRHEDILKSIAEDS